MPDNLFTIILPFLTSIVSVIIAVLIARMKNKVELDKIKIQNDIELSKIFKELDHKYAKSLFDKRIEYYPILGETLSKYTETIRLGMQTIDNLHAFSENINAQIGKFWLFFTEDTLLLFAKLRFYLTILLESSKPELSSENWADIRKMIQYFETMLRAEIGIYSIKSAGTAEKTKEAYEFIQTRIDNLTGIKYNPS